MTDVSSGKKETTASGPHSGHGTDPDERSGLLQLAVFSLVAGLVPGLVVGPYRLCLEQADHFRSVLIEWAHQWSILGLVLVAAACGVATAIAAWMVRRLSPHAAGGGITHVEKVL